MKPTEIELAAETLRRLRAVEEFSKLYGDEEVHSIVVYSDSDINHNHPMMDAGLREHMTAALRGWGEKRALELREELKKIGVVFDEPADA